MNGMLRERSHFLAAVGAVLIWSVSFVATKVAFRTFPPLTLGASRFILAALVMGALLCARREFARPTRTDLLRLALSGLLGITLYFSLENWGVKLATAADASLIVAAYPAITMILEFLLYRVRISGFRILGVGLAIIGVYLIVRESAALGGPHRLLGDFILAAAGVVWASYNFVTRKVVRSYPSIPLSFYQMVAGSVAFIPLAMSERSAWRPPDLHSLLALLYLAVFCSAAGFLLYAYSLKSLSSSSAVTLMNLVPVFGVIFSALFLHERLGVLQLVGGALVISGIAMSVGRAKRENAEEQTVDAG